MILVFIQTNLEGRGIWWCGHVWEARWDILSVHLQKDPSAVSAEHLLLGWSTVLLLAELCNLFLMLVTGRRNQDTKEAHVIHCEVVLMLPWSSTAIASQEHFCFCSFKLMHLCAHLSCCLLPRRKTRKINWARNTLKLLAFYLNKIVQSVRAKMSWSVSCWSNGNGAMPNSGFSFIQGHSWCFPSLLRRMAWSAGSMWVLKWNHGAVLFPIEMFA